MKAEPHALDPLRLVLDPAAPLSLQQQLRQKLVDAIHRGVLRPGQQLPASRQLADRMGVSRNTVSLAYDALLAEGYLASRARSGMFVANNMASSRIGAGRRRPAPESPLAARLPPATEDTGFRTPQHWHRYPFPFVDGCIDSELTPAAEWGEAIRLAGSRHEVLQWHRDNSDTDDGMLMEEVRDKLLPMRGIQAGPDEVLMAASCGHALQLAAELLIRRGTPVVLALPADPAFERRLRERHAEVSWLDRELHTALPQGAVVVTSCRHGFAADCEFPQRLLARVAEADGVLIEHDVPAGVHDGGRIAPALHALDPQGRVVYVGGFASVVSCGEPPGVLVASADFIDRARQLRRTQGTAPPRVMQRAWAYFIGLGHYSAGLVRASRVLAKRRTELRDALNHYLHQRVSIDTAPGTSAYWVSVPEGVDARELARQAAAIGVLVEPSRRSDGQEALCMGVTGLPAARIREGVRTLARLLRGDLSPSSRRIEADAVAPLRGKALRRAMAGASLLYSTVYGEPCTLEIHADGNLTGTAGYDGEDCDRGHWWIEGDRWYRQWQQWAYGEASGYALVVDGDQLRLYGEDGFLADTAVLLPAGKRRTR
jgi:GntR family transcriptional regulator/MocR family aminotransferase